MKGPMLAAGTLPACLLLLAGCGPLSPDSNGDRPAGARAFPRADRPVATIVSTRRPSEEASARVNEAEDIMDRAGILPGLPSAAIGPGERYYTLRQLGRTPGRER